MIDITEKDEAIVFSVRVVPRASKSELVGEHDGALKVRLAAPPVDGAANAALVKLLAGHLRTAKSDIEITGGQNSKTKQIRVRNCDRQSLLAALNIDADG